MSVRTSVELEKVVPLFEGRHQNPFEVLGPHPVVAEGRPAMAVRAYLPNSQQAWVVDAAHSRLQPMRRIHPAGLYEAICPMPQDQANNQYLLRVADNAGTQSMSYDPYAFPPLLTDFDLYLLGEGRHWSSYSKLGAQLRTVDDVDGRQFRRLGPQRHRRQHHRRLQRLGWPPASDAQAHSVRHLGIVHPRPDRWDAVQIPDPQLRRSVRKIRPLRICRRAAAAHRVEGHRPQQLPMARRPVDAHPAEVQRVGRSGLDL